MQGGLHRKIEVGNCNTNKMCYDEKIITLETTSRIRINRVQDVTGIRHVRRTQKMHAAIAQVTSHRPLLRRDGEVTLLANKHHSA